MKAHLDGVDKTTSLLIPYINVWKDYLKRDHGYKKTLFGLKDLSIIATLKHGKRVKVIKEYGNYVCIQFGILRRKGFVNREFIRELKK